MKNNLEIIYTSDLCFDCRYTETCDRRTCDLIFADGLMKSEGDGDSK